MLSLSITKPAFPFLILLSLALSAAQRQNKNVKNIRDSPIKQTFVSPSQDKGLDLF